MQDKSKIPPDLKERKDQLHSIKALGDTPGGQELVSLLVEDIVNGMHQLIGGVDHIKVIAEMKVRMELAQLIISAEESEKHLDTLIKEALSQ